MLSSKAIARRNEEQRIREIQIVERALRCDPNTLAKGHVNEVPDEFNPAFVLQGTATALLLAAANGKLDLQKLARRELANRGVDETGRWVGFSKAAIVHGVK